VISELDKTEGQPFFPRKKGTPLRYLTGVSMQMNFFKTFSENSHCVKRVALRPSRRPFRVVSGSPAERMYIDHFAFSTSKRHGALRSAAVLPTRIQQLRRVRLVRPMRSSL
jgi:hypothetical protein